MAVFDVPPQGLSRNVKYGSSFSDGKSRSATGGGNWQPLAKFGLLLKEAVRGGHQILHLRQGAAGRFQRRPTLQISARRATFSSSHCQNNALIGPSMVRALGPYWLPNSYNTKDISKLPHSTYRYQ